MKTAEVATDLELAEAATLSANLAAWNEAHGGVRLQALGRAWLVDAGASPLSRAYGLGFDGPVGDRHIDELESFYADQPVRIEVCPYAHGTLITTLRRRGYLLEGLKEVLVRPLDAPPELEAVEVERVTPATEGLAAKTIARGFAQGRAPGPHDLRLAAQLVRPVNGAAFLARIDGEPVGGGVMSVHDGRVALYAASTLPAFRRRGVQSALIAARLRAGFDQGARLATIQSAPGVSTRPTAERRGFHLLYTKASCVRDGGSKAR